MISLNYVRSMFYAAKNLLLVILIRTAVSLYCRIAKFIKDTSLSKESLSQKEVSIKQCSLNDHIGDHYKTRSRPEKVFVFNSVQYL